MKAQYDLAIELYQQAINLDPNLIGTHNSLGILYTEKGKYELAITSFQKEIEIDPQNAYAFLNLGFVLGLQGNQDKAIAEWKQGLELLTGNSQHERLFRALHEVGIGEIERGINCLREILKIEKPPVGILSEVLKGAEIMARFPAKLEGIDTVIEMLKQAIQNAQ